MKRFGRFVLEGKTDHFAFICRLFLTTTVFIAMRTDFIAMKTVVTTHDIGTSRQRRRSSWESSAHLTAESRKKSFDINGSVPALSANIRFSGSLALSYFLVFSGQTDTTELITG